MIPAVAAWLLLLFALREPERVSKSKKNAPIRLEWLEQVRARRNP